MNTSPVFSTPRINLEPKVAKEPLRDIITGKMVEDKLNEIAGI